MKREMKHVECEIKADSNSVTLGQYLSDQEYGSIEISVDQIDVLVRWLQEAKAELTMFDDPHAVSR